MKECLAKPKSRKDIRKPIISTTGASGGYEISEKYTLDNDFATLNDYSNIRTALQGLVSATDDPKVRHTVALTYTNNNCETRPHCVEPIAVIYRWYAWYLLAYSRVKKDYRTYKLVRMSDLKMSSSGLERCYHRATM